MRTCFFPKEAKTKYSAIDLHSNNHVLVVTDETERVLVEKRLPNELKRIVELLAPHKDELAPLIY